MNNNTFHKALVHTKLPLSIGHYFLVEDEGTERLYTEFDPVGLRILKIGYKILNSCRVRVEKWLAFEAIKVPEMLLIWIPDCSVTIIMLCPITNNWFIGVN
jgi:hypothetical protein